jgi:hypothetical protein
MADLALTSPVALTSPAGTVALLRLWDRVRGQRLGDRAQVVRAASAHVGSVGVWVVTSAARRPRRASTFREAKTWLAASRLSIVHHDIRRASDADEQRQAAWANSTTAKYRGRLQRHRCLGPEQLPPSDTKPLFMGRAAGLLGARQPFLSHVAPNWKRGLTPVRRATAQNNGRKGERARYSRNPVALVCTDTLSTLAPRQPIWKQMGNRSSPDKTHPCNGSNEPRRHSVRGQTRAVAKGRVSVYLATNERAASSGKLIRMVPLLSQQAISNKTPSS